ncbi:MAG: glycosyltransferase family 4 protein [Candidatus Saccharibacteria bacterium]
MPNAVRLQQFAGAHSDSTATNIVFLGRLVVRKGCLQLLRAVAYLRAHGLYEGDFRVIVGGKGELLPELKRFVAEHRLGEIVSFHGFVDETEKAGFLAAGDIAVYPSSGGESFGIVLLEAMAAARGVVLGGDNPGYASVLAPYPDQLFDPADTPAFAEKLAWYLKHPDERRRAAAEQHAYVKRFDVDTVGRELLEVYSSALQKRPQT